MFKELFELGQNVGVILPPVGYDYLIADVEIHIDHPFSISPIFGQDIKGKEYLGKAILLPSIVRSSNATSRPLPIADKGEFLFGTGKKQTNYHNLLEECFDTTQDKAVQEILNLLQRLTPERVIKDCSPWLDGKKSGKSLEEARFVFLYRGQLVTDRPEIKQFWAKKFAEISGISDIGQCTISGKQEKLVKSTLPTMIKGVPATQGKGAQIISFNIDSVASRKWEKLEHSPISFEVAERSHQMLNKLLREDRHSYKQGKMAFVYWGEYDEGLNGDIWENPEELWDDDSAEVAEMIFTSPDDPNKFIDLSNCNSTKFYLAILRGCDGRIAISRWSETNPAEISKNVVHYIKTQKSIPGYKARPIWQLANSCFRDPKKEQTAPVVKALVLHALWGKPIPLSIVSKAMERIYLDLFSRGNDHKYYSRYRSRFQILALYVNSMKDSKSPEMARRLKIAQQLGAVAYLMHDAEMTARNLDDVGKTGVAGSLRALSTTPQQVFGRLYQNAILYHLPTSCNDGESEKRESRRRRLKRIGKLLREEFNKLVEMKLTPETDLPTTFNLDENAWFHLGWAMREATFWAGFEKSDNNNNDTNNQEEE
ncbi:MAG: type I-C CRISPR-associated protein Cas8c/Csd1 [Xenococcus sp. (in: cyanobacteria)]